MIHESRLFNRLCSATFREHRTFSASATPLRPITRGHHPALTTQSRMIGDLSWNRRCLNTDIGERTLRKPALPAAQPGWRNGAPDPCSVISFQSFELPVEPLSSGPSCLQSLLSPPTTPSSCRQSWRVSRRSPRSSRRSPRSSRRSSRRSMRRVSARTMFPFWNRPLPANAAAGVALMPADEIKLSARTDKKTLGSRRRLQVIRFLH